MRTLQTLITTGLQHPRGRLFWFALGALAVAQLFAFWLVCSQQVRKAEARDVAPAHQMAQADCPQGPAGCGPDATIFHASMRQAGDAPTAGPVRVSYR